MATRKTGAAAAVAIQPGSVVVPGQKLLQRPIQNEEAGADLKPGRGTYLHDGAITASVVGILHCSPTHISVLRSTSAGSASTRPSTDSKTESNSEEVPAGMDGMQLPRVKSIVLGKILRTTPRTATLSILSTSAPPSSFSSSSSDTSSSSSVPGTTFTAAAGTPMHASRSGPGSGSGEEASYYQALIRVQDIRATQKDSIKMADSFRPGDIVRAEIIALGDQANFYASTARNELGVVIAYPQDVSARGGAAAAGGGEDRPMVPVSWETMRDVRTGREEKRKVAKPF